MLSSTSRDTEISPAPNDTPSCIAWGPNNDFLAVSSWDNQTRLYQVQGTNTQPKSTLTHDAPALCCVFSSDGSKLFSGGADKQIRVLDMQSGQPMNFVGHSEPIKSMKWDKQHSMLVTGSWDKTIKYWDLRSQNPVATVQLPERCYDMDIANSLLAVATAERKVCIIDLNNPTTIFKTVDTTLKWQTRSIACFPDAKGVAIGTIEGRSSIINIDTNDQSLNFTFKCHRVDNKVYAVNAIDFHPSYGTLVTCGNDCTYSIWDKNAKQRLKSATNVGAPITCCAFSPNGQYLAYGVGYDWSQGFEHAKNVKNAVYLNRVNDSEVKPKPKTGMLRR